MRAPQRTPDELRTRSARPVRRPVRRHSAFTLIELLVVIAIIAILVAMVGIVGTQLMGVQRSNYTRNIMRGTKLAIDQFAEVHPLRDIYDRHNNSTFGAYPPYQLAGGALPTHVRGAVEPLTMLWSGSYTLQDRLRRDLTLPTGAPVILGNDGRNDDIRALWAYLSVFAPETLAQVPDDAKRPLVTGLPAGEYFNTQAGDPTDARVGVLGLHDAWGVPLDYLLYVRLEYALLPNGSPGWRVAERMPVLRSRGITREQYEVALRASNADTALQEYAGQEIWTDSLPHPVASVNAVTGQMLGVGRANAGWVRARAGWNNGLRSEDYGYIP